MMTTMTTTTRRDNDKKKVVRAIFTFEIIKSNSHTHPTFKRLKRLKASESIRRSCPHSNISRNFLWQVYKSFSRHV